MTTQQDLNLDPEALDSFSSGVMGAQQDTGATAQGADDLTGMNSVGVTSPAAGDTGVADAEAARTTDAAGGGCDANAANAGCGDNATASANSGGAVAAGTAANDGNAAITGTDKT